MNWDSDVIYLGPEFQVAHLEQFLKAKGKGMELEGVKFIALDRKLWVGGREWHPGRQRYLGDCLQEIGRRGVEEVWIVPDDECNMLEDRFYYRKHKVEFFEPGKRERWGTNKVATMVEQWMGELWRGGSSETGEDSRNMSSGADGSGVKVRVKSIRRNRRRLGFFRLGVEEIAQAVWENARRPLLSQGWKDLWWRFPDFFELQ